VQGHWPRKHRRQPSVKRPPPPDNGLRRLADRGKQLNPANRLHAGLAFDLSFKGGTVAVWDMDLDDASQDDCLVAVDEDEVAHRPTRNASPTGRSEGLWQVQFDPGRADFGHSTKALFPVDQRRAVIRRHGPALGYAQVEPPAVAGRSPQ